MKIFIHDHRQQPAPKQQKTRDGKKPVRGRWRDLGTRLRIPK